VQNGYITDGVSSNVGWYGTLAIVYNIFGFSVFTAKYFRLALHLVFLCSLAFTFRKWMGPVKAILPLALIGLSPVLLYYNTFQASFGTDLQYAGICLGLVCLLRFNKSLIDLLIHFFLGAIAMLAAMSYPAFILYLPVLLLIYLIRWRTVAAGTGAGSLITGSVTAAAGLFLPLAAAFQWINNNELLIHDPVSGTGLFRGGGKAEWTLNVLSAGIKQTFSDLFSKGTSYYFDLARPDFAGGAGAVLFLSVIGAGIYFFITKKETRIPLGLSMLLLVLNLIIPNFSSNFPGLRRCTGILAGYYGIAVVLYYYTVLNFNNRPALRWMVYGSLILLPLHSLVSMRDNLKSLREPGPFRESWFTIEKSPEHSLAKLMNAVENGQSLACNDASGQPGPCRYFEVYSAIAGYRYWNNLPGLKIMGYDWYKKEYVPLSVQMWAQKKFPF
jgi:hypothetical protein